MFSPSVSPQNEGVSSHSSNVGKWVTYPVIPGTRPTRGQFVKSGDVVYLTPDQRRRVLSIKAVPNTIYYVGVWEVLDVPLPYRERFELCFVAFYTVERAQ